MFQKICFAVCIFTDYSGFSKIFISQGSVATQFRCGGTFNNRFIAHFSQSMIVK